MSFCVLVPGDSRDGSGSLVMRFQGSMRLLKTSSDVRPALTARIDASITYGESESLAESVARGFY
jgi:hypothetical protein